MNKRSAEPFQAQSNCKCFAKKGDNMSLEVASEENMKILLEELADKLQVVNRTIMEPEDYDLEKYEDLKFMYDMVVQKGRLSASETQAFIEELSLIRK